MAFSAFSERRRARLNTAAARLLPDGTPITDIGLARFAALGPAGGQPRAVAVTPSWIVVFDVSALGARPKRVLTTAPLRAWPTEFGQCRLGGETLRFRRGEFTRLTHAVETAHELTLPMPDD